MTAQWQDGQYGSYYLYPVKDTRALCVCVAWDSMRPRGSTEPAGYTVTFAGLTLKNRPRELDEAKRLGVALAKKILTDALAGLQ